MSSKRQLTVPKVIADQYGIRPGDELQWFPAGEVIRVVPARQNPTIEQTLSIAERLDLFDKATRRQRQREVALKRDKTASSRIQGRGWRREDLYRRGLSD